MQNDAPVTRRRGRPRNPLLEDSILAAAAQVYGRHGWAGFGFDAVAREAGVGKSTLYNRWTDAADLLAYLIKHRWQAVETIDTGRLDSDLLRFAQFVMARYKETGGGIAWHLRRDMAADPQLAERIGGALAQTSELCLDILRRARSRGELRAGVSLSLTTQLLLSALETYAAQHQSGSTTTPEADTEHIRRVLELLKFGITRE